MSERKIDLTFSQSNGDKQVVSFNVKDGQGSYEKWAALPENKGKSKEEYIESLQGQQGVGVVGVDVETTELTPTPEGE